MLTLEEDLEYKCVLIPGFFSLPRPDKERKGQAE